MGWEVTGGMDIYVYIYIYIFFFKGFVTRRQWGNIIAAPNKCVIKLKQRKKHLW